MDFRNELGILNKKTLREQGAVDESFERMEEGRIPQEVTQYKPHGRRDIDWTLKKS